jgi:hypothetical protein
MNPVWRSLVDEHASSPIDKRVLAKGARVAAGNPPTAIAASSRRPLSGGFIPADDWPGREFGANRNATTTYTRRSPAGTTHQVTRHTRRQLPARNPSGRVVYAAVRQDRAPPGVPVGAADRTYVLRRRRREGVSRGRHSDPVHRRGHRLPAPASARSPRRRRRFPRRRHRRRQGHRAHTTAALDDTGDAADKLERKFRDVFDTVSKESKKAGDSLGDSMHDGTRKAGEGVDEFRDEANSPPRRPPHRSTGPPTRSPARSRRWPPTRSPGSGPRARSRVWPRPPVSGSPSRPCRSPRRPPTI